MSRRKLVLVMLAATLVLAAVYAVPERGEVAEQIMSRYARGRLMFLYGYELQVEATTATAGLKWQAVKRMTQALADTDDFRALFADLSAEEQHMATVVLKQMNAAWYKSRRAALLEAEDQETSGL